jgi:hypothetical protein
MKKIGIVITDGVGYRNFILSDFITEANNNFDEVIIYSCLPKTVYDTLNFNCKIVELAVFEEKFYTWFFRKLKEIAHLQLHRSNNFGIRDNFNSNKSKAITPRGYATRFVYKITQSLHSEKWIHRFYKLQKRTLGSNAITKKYIQLLNENNITMLFFTHQRPPFISPLLFAAEKLKIKTGTFIFSWDNLASKSRMVGTFNYYLVWSDLMKKELLHFYASVKENQVRVVGTPQFETYVMGKYGYDKSHLINKFKINSNLPIILFTCNDASMGNDPIYLELLSEFIKNGKLIKEVTVIVRTSPAEEPLRFKNTAEKYPFLVWNFPDWKISRENHQETWTQRVPSVEDLNDLKSLLNHCDFNINVLSTITLDAFLFDKPVINPVFGNNQNELFDDQKFLHYAHLAKLVESNSTIIAKNEIEFLEAINKMLSLQDDKKSEREKFLNLQISEPLKGTSNRIATTLFHLND